MELVTLITSPIGTNTYILINKSQKTAVVVDPGDNAPLIFDTLKKQDCVCSAVLLTHAHFDHCNATKELQNAGAKVYLYKEEQILLDTDFNLAHHFGIKFNAFTPDVTLDDGDNFDECGFNFTIIHTPGHTIGSVCYLYGNMIFSGDTLFKLGRGRTDFPTGDYGRLCQSISKLFALDGDYIVYPGHGEKTLLDYERRYNLD